MTSHPSSKGLVIDELRITARILDKELGAGWKIHLRKRYVMCIILFFGLITMYSLQANIDNAIVAMKEEHTTFVENNTIITVNEFQWDSEFQAVILSSFYYGYTLTQVPGAWLAKKTSPTLILGSSMLITSLLTITTPFITYESGYLLIIWRMLEGLFQGLIHPAIYTILSKWIPPDEYSVLITLVYSGGYFGTFAVLLLSGIIADSLGWSCIFYITGVFGVLWCLFLFIMVRDSPSEYENIRVEELYHIQASLEENNVIESATISWKRVITSLPVWSVVFSNFVENWGFFTLLTQFPTFLSDNIDFDAEQSGVMTSLQYFFLPILMQFTGIIARKIERKQCIQKVTLRKAYISGAFMVQGALIVLVGYVSVDFYYVMIVSVTAAMTITAFTLTAISVNIMDLSPQHSGLIMGLCQTLGSLPGIVSPLITGYIVENDGIKSWSLMFYICGGLYFLGMVIYGVFGSAELLKERKVS